MKHNDSRSSLSRTETTTMMAICYRSFMNLDIPPLVQFFVVVDTSKLVLVDNPGIGLDNITRNCSAIF